MVGKRIRKIRKKLGLTMQEFGNMVSNSPRSTVSTWEHGGNLPSKEKIELIAQIGSVNSEWIKWGDFSDYIESYLLFLGYERYIEDNKYIIKNISSQIQKSHSLDFSKFPADANYSKFNRSIELIFNKAYLNDLSELLSEVMHSIIDENNCHELYEANKKKIFNNYYDEIVAQKIEWKNFQEYKTIAYKIIDKYSKNQINQLNNPKYSSVDDYFHTISENQFDIEKFLLDLSKRYNFPYEKNSKTAKILLDNHKNFK